MSLFGHSLYFHFVQIVSDQLEKDGSMSKTRVDIDNIWSVQRQPRLLHLSLGTHYVDVFAFSGWVDFFFNFDL